jgi:prepilin signal peptidase PulO-like enzyme (type II secretory pathway)
MDLSILNEYLVFVVMVACLVVGYIIKHATFFKFINNKDIPVILAVVGLIINLFVSGFSIESAVYGAAMGLMSTGLHQTFKKFVEKSE